MAFNPLVPPARRFETTKMTPGRPVPKPTHVVCHITGDDDFEAVKNTFLTSNASAHYVVDKAGLIYRFVDEKNQAWHSGIAPPVQKLYNNNSPADWRRYLCYFGWYSKYPADAVYLDEELNPAGSGKRTFVRQANGAEWLDYRYFKTRWGANAGPYNYPVSKKPNTYSVGIEILSYGAKTASPTAYTEAMYASLRTLVTDISNRHQIPMAKGWIVGHEDVNPVQRWGWDPNQGFDWSRVWT